MSLKVKEKMERLKAVFAGVQKQYGEGAIMRLGSAPSGLSVPAFSTGSLGLDIALGTGGYPRGRLIEVYGPESSGKTTLTLHAIAEIQRSGGIAAFIDAEHALDVTYAAKLGVDVGELLVSQPDYGEQALEITEKLVSSGAVELVVVDSVAALTPKAELDGEMGDHHVGLQARMMSQAMRKLTGTTHKTGATIIFINQIRHKIGVQFGSPETTTGGNALKFYASVRIDVRRSSKIKSNKSQDQKQQDDTIGNRTIVKVVKNKMAPPFRRAEFDILFGQGIFRTAEVLDHAVEQNLVQKSGAYFSMGDERLGHGRDNAIGYLQEHPEVERTLADRIVKLCLAPREEAPSDKKEGRSKDKEGGQAA
jgi:recombination protein RecA